MSDEIKTLRIKRDAHDALDLIQNRIIIANGIKFTYGQIVESFLYFVSKESEKEFRLFIVRCNLNKKRD